MVINLKNKQGFVSIYAIIMLAVLIPFMFFVAIDLPYYYRMNRNTKNALDNATSTAITCLDETYMANGRLYIDESEATKRAYDVIKEYYYLNDDLTPKENSLITEKPTINIQVINQANGQIVETANGTTTITNPSVVIYAEIPITGKFFTITKKIKHTAVSQVQFK